MAPACDEDFLGIDEPAFDGGLGDGDDVVVLLRPHSAAGVGGEGVAAAGAAAVVRAEDGVARGEEVGGPVGGVAEEVAEGVGVAAVGPAVDVDDCGEGIWWGGGWGGREEDALKKGAVGGGAGKGRGRGVEGCAKFGHGGTVLGELERCFVAKGGRGEGAGEDFCWSRGGGHGSYYSGTVGPVSEVDVPCFEFVLELAELDFVQGVEDVGEAVLDVHDGFVADLLQARGTAVVAEGVSGPLFGGEGEFVDALRGADAAGLDAGEEVEG